MTISKFTGKYKFLSNFYSANLRYEGIYYPTSEHAYQAAKTINRSIKMKIALLATPALAKKMGKTIPITNNWDKVKLQVMEDIVRAKFKDTSLQILLLETKDAELIEGNTWGDVYWGVCNNTGENHLGKILMKIREEIRSGYQK